jgi:hypothetical protein
MSPPVAFTSRAAADLDDRDVEGAAAEVVDQHALVELLPDAVGEGGRGRLVDDPDHLEIDERPGLLHRLALAVGEVGRDRDHGTAHLEAQVVGGDVADLREDLGADLGDVEAATVALEGDVVLVAGVDLELDRALDRLDHLVLRRAPDETLRRVEGVLRVQLPLALGLVADELVPLVVDRVDRGDGVVAPLVRDELDLPVAVGDGAARVGRTEVDPDDRVGGELRHGCWRVLRRGGPSGGPVGGLLHAQQGFRPLASSLNTASSGRSTATGRAGN